MMSIRRKLILLYLSPFLVQILLIVPLFLKNIEINTDLAMLSLLLDLGTPLFLLIVNMDFAFKRNKKSFLISGILVLLISVLIQGISYLRWGIDTGLLLNPDYGTVLVVKYEIYWAIIVSIAGSIICQFILLHRHKIHKN